MSLRTLGRLAGTGIVVLSSLALAIQGHAKAAPAANPVTAISGLHVVGNKLANSAGQTVVLHGVNRSGTEYACVQDWDIFNGPSDAASVQAIAAWHVNAVRVPLNEDCWLSINGVDPQYSGTTYRQAIANYVSLLNQNGMAAILDLHWTAPGATLAEDQQPMADTDHSIDFWQSVAGTFKGNQWSFRSVQRALPGRANNFSNATEAWTCLRDGGTCTGIAYPVAGMQSLVNAVRATGATNVIMTGGLTWTNDLSQWLAYAAEGPDREPDRLLALLQLQRLHHHRLLEHEHRRGRREGPGPGRRDRPEQLQPRLHRPGDGLGRHERRRLHRLDLEPVGRLQQQAGTRPDHRLDRHAPPPRTARATTTTWRVWPRIRTPRSRHPRCTW